MKWERKTSNSKKVRKNENTGRDKVRKIPKEKKTHRHKGRIRKWKISKRLRYRKEIILHLHPANYSWKERMIK